MATAEEIEEEFLKKAAARSGQEYTPREKKKELDTGESIAAEFLSRSRKRNPAPEVEPVEEGPGVFTRALDKTRLGLTDAAATFWGDEYTDDLEPAPRPILTGERPLRVAGNVLRGVGEGIGEIVSAGDEAIGSPLAKSMEYMEKNRAAHPIYSQSGIRQGMEDLREYSPRIADVAEDVGALAATVGPSKFLPDMKGPGVLTKLDKSRAKGNRTDIERRWEPDRKDAQGRFEPNALGRDEYAQTPFEVQMLDDLESVDGLNPRKSYAQNFNVLNDTVEDLRKDLDKKLLYADQIPTRNVKSSVADAVDSIESSASLRGDAKALAKDIYKEYAKRLDKLDEAGTIRPGALLQLRRDLDRWITEGNTKGKVWDPQTLSAQAIATKAIRDQINKLVISASDNVDVAESLRKQSSLLTARDQIAPKYYREPKTGVGRAVAKVETETGLGAPQTPLALVANLQYWPAVAAGVGMSGYSLGKNALRSGAAAGKALGQEAGKQAYLAGRGPLTLAAMAEALREEEENAKSP